MNVIYFSDQQEFRQWLEENHLSAGEVFVGFYKVKTGKPSMTWSQSVDQALCFGWIDSTRRSVDEERYCIRFTPRNKKSIWSAVNISKVEALSKAGLMMEAGLKAYSYRDDSRSKVYAHEMHTEISDEYVKLFKKKRAAWNFYEKQPPSYKKIIAHWVMSAKQEKTRISRLEKVISESGHQRVIRFM